MKRLSAAVGVLCAGSVFAATPPSDPVSLDELLSPARAPKAIVGGVNRAIAEGGAVRLRFNHDRLAEIGIGPVSIQGRADAKGAAYGVDVDFSPYSRFELDGTTKLVHGLAGGQAQLLGDLELPKLGVVIAQPRLVVRSGGEGSGTERVDLVGRDGAVMFYADTFMYEFVEGGNAFRVRSADLKISTMLAELVGKPQFADHPVGELKLRMPVVARTAVAEPKNCVNPEWPGVQVPGQPAGTVYQADVFMDTFSGSIMRCRISSSNGAGCDGPGATDGDVVIAPSSTLKNNVNNGTAVPTEAGDPRGTSQALWAADVPWYDKFTENSHSWTYPYPNHDQHPYLIWNLYRINAAGQIEQIGRSGVKHAFLTVNTNCATGQGCDSHILGRACGDTYGTGNNDAAQDLGPRHEILPATGQWGRCGSLFDPDCNNAENGTGNGSFGSRMIVKESTIDPAVNTGATYLFESWYIVRDDIDIWNTMAARAVSFGWGGAWTINNTPPGGAPFRLGPAIDRWVAPSETDPMQRNVEVRDDEGRAKVAVKVTDLGNGSWRYDYAVFNADFARGETTGQETNHTFRVLRNYGFGGFTVPRGAGVNITQASFADGDGDPANDWVPAVGASDIHWKAPSDPASLNWGTLYRFSFVADSPPQNATVNLDVTDPGTPAAFNVGSLLSPTPRSLSVDAPSSVGTGEDGSTGALPFTVADTETPSGDLLVSASSDNPTLLPPGSMVLAGGGANRTITLTPAANRSGSATVTLTVTDGDNNTATDTFTLTVFAVNDRPSFAIAGDVADPPLTTGLRTRPGFVTSFDLGPLETQNVLGYTVVETSDPANMVSGAAIAPDGTLSYTLTGAAGVASFSVTLRDDGGTSNGGIDTSLPITFNIGVAGDALFQDGFESP